MKKILSFLLIAFVFTGISKAQDNFPSIYSTSSWEMIFSWADVDNMGNSEGVIGRFAPAFNLSNNINFDLASFIGVYSGIGFRNVGFIYDVPDDENPVRMKYRTYNLAIPAGLKLGSLKKFFIYGGYEFEYPFHYKEKTFQNEVKTDKYTIWFSDRVESVQHSLFAGIQFKGGLNLKFKYYLTNFHNMDFTQIEDGIETQPYKHMEVNVFYFSLNFSLFRNAKFYYSEQVKNY